AMCDLLTLLRSWKRRRKMKKRSCIRLKPMASVMTNRTPQKQLDPPNLNRAAATRLQTARQMAPQQLSLFLRSTTPRPLWTREIQRSATAPRIRQRSLSVGAALPVAPRVRVPVEIWELMLKQKEAQNHQQMHRSSLVTPQKEKTKRRSWRKLVLLVLQPMSIQQRDGRVARGGGVCSPSRQSTQTGRLREGWEREGAPFPSA
ncbi:hypothetical protein AMECASPLE_019822, partial [Ameca splendens]